MVILKMVVWTQHLSYAFPSYPTLFLQLIVLRNSTYFSVQHCNVCYEPGNTPLFWKVFRENVFGIYMYTYVLFRILMYAVCIYHSSMRFILMCSESLFSTISLNLSSAIFRHLILSEPNVFVRMQDEPMAHGHCSRIIWNC